MLSCLQLEVWFDTCSIMLLSRAVECGTVWAGVTGSSVRTLVKGICGRGVRELFGYFGTKILLLLMIMYGPFCIYCLHLAIKNTKSTWIVFIYVSSVTSRSIYLCPTLWTLINKQVFFFFKLGSHVAQVVLKLSLKLRIASYFYLRSTARYSRCVPACGSRDRTRGFLPMKLYPQPVKQVLLKRSKSAWFLETVWTSVLVWTCAHLVSILLSIIRLLHMHKMELCFCPVKSVIINFDCMLDSTWRILKNKYVLVPLKT